MRKLKLQVQMSIDGFVAGPNGELDWMWVGKKDQAIYTDVIGLADACDTILLGRKMTREFIDYWESVVDTKPDSEEYPLAQRMVNLQKVVFTKTQNEIKGRNLRVENGDLVTAVTALKQQDGKDIMVYGGANFVSALIANNLVDEFYIFRRPAAIGKGLSIFHDRMFFELENTVKYKNGTVLFKYVPAKLT